MLENTIIIDYHEDNGAEICEKFNILVQNNETGFTLLANYKSEIIGIISLSEFSKKQSDITYFSVIPVFRGKGIGSLLVKKAINVCKQKNIKQISIKCDDKHKNIVLINNFLTKNGLRELQYDYSCYRFRREDFYKSFVREFTNKGFESFYNKKYSIISLKETDRCNLKFIQKELQNKISDFVLNLEEDKRIIPEISLSLFFRNKVIACIVFGYVSDSEISVLATFVKEEYRKNELAFKLWAYAHLKAEELKITEKIKWISFGFSKNKKELLTLYHRLFRSYLHEEFDCFTSITEI